MIRRTPMVGALAVALALSPSGCSDEDDDKTPSICPVDKKCSSGSTYKELAISWFKWFIASPQWQSPALDEDGKHCHVGQPAQEKVWFLAGTTQSDKVIKRTCSVPADRGLFFPILSGQCNACLPCEDCALQGLKPSECVGEPQTDEQLLECIGGFGDLVTKGSLEAKIDNIPVADLETFRVTTGVFKATGVDDDRHRWIPCSKGERGYAGDGYWLFVEPLSVGKHRISFKGKMTGGFNLDVQYELDVQESSQHKNSDLGPEPDIPPLEAGPQCPPADGSSADAAGADQAGSGG